MVSRRYADGFDCPVANHRVTITGEKVYPYGQGPLPVDMARSFGRCTGESECKIFQKPMIAKPTGCPYYDANCSSYEPY
jgi:hypothetical protein